MLSPETLDGFAQHPLLVGPIKIHVRLPGLLTVRANVAR
jgi:hypothetical protein